MVPAPSKKQSVGYERTWKLCAAYTDDGGQSFDPSIWLAYSPTAQPAHHLKNPLGTCKAYQFANGMPDRKMGGPCALLKVQASKTFEYCAREASQIFGGASYVRGEGQGSTVERLYREVRGTAIPGGSEEIMLDLAMRQARL